MDILASLVRIIVPIAVVSKGELVGERVGILNLGIEGNMLLGSFVGWWLAIHTHSIAVGLVGAVVVGLVIGAIMWVLVDIMEFSHHIAGLGIGFLCSGLALTLFRLVPVEYKLNSIMFSGNEVMYLWIILGLLVLGTVSLELIAKFNYVGLRWDSVGHDLRSADLLGIEIRIYRLISCMFAGMMAFLGGAILSVIVTRSFTIGIVSGRGWLALCLVMLAQWKFKYLLPAVSVWAGLELLQFHAQAVGVNIPYQLLLMIPYVGCILVVIWSVSRGTAPEMLLSTYKRNEDAA